MRGQRHPKRWTHTEGEDRDTHREGHTRDMRGQGTHREGHTRDRRGQGTHRDTHTEMDTHGRRGQGRTQRRTHAG